MRLLSLRQQGSALVTVIIILPFLIIICGQYMSLSLNSLFIAKRDQSRTHAQLAADAGIDYSMQRVNQDPLWTGTDPETNPGAEFELMNNGDVRTTYEVSVTNINPDTKIVRSIGRTFRPTTNTSPESTITIDVNLRAVESGFYSVVSGVGGLIMTNSAKILGGDVFINGKITLSNSAQIGLSTNPVTLDVAHQACPNPPTATYAQICASGENGQPISMNGTSRIYGTVRANNQTNGAGMSSPGLTASSGISSLPLPPHDRAAQIAAVPSTAANNITGAAASCSNGTRNWPANIKIIGDVTISNDCKVTVNGNVWITGKLELRNSSEMIVASSLGVTRPVVMIDGESATFRQSSLLRSNADSTGFMIITYKSDDTCTTQIPGGCDLTGPGLFNSQNDTTIELDNSASGPNTIFYARWTKVQVKNSGQIGALIGQTVELNNSGTITFGTSTGTGTFFWVIDSYRRVI